KRQLVLPILLFHRLKAEQVRLHRQQVLSCDARVGGEGKGRKIMFSLRIDTVPERLHERFVRPVADTGLWVRSNVRYEERAERRFKRPPARKWPRVLALVGMTGDATACVDQVLPTLDELFVGPCRHHSQQKRRSEGKGVPASRNRAGTCHDSPCRRRPHRETQRR